MGPGGHLSGAPDQPVLRCPRAQRNGTVFCVFHAVVSNQDAKLVTRCSSPVYSSEAQICKSV